MTKTIVTVLGYDQRGIIAKVSNFLYEREINIEDISQTIMQDYFTMIMLVDLSESGRKLSDLAEEFENLGKEIGVSVRIQHEDVFDSMHKL